MKRRAFLKGTAAGAAVLSLHPWLSWPARAGAQPRVLFITRRTIEVKGRAASVFGLLQPDGTPGLRLRADESFNMLLRNESDEPTLVHWHGLTPPWASDGVPDAPMPMIAAGEERAYDFPLGKPGTYWMHAHSLQEQALLAAPLIVADPADDGRDEQEVVVLLHDFSFSTPEELLAQLTSGGGHAGDGGTTSTGGMAMDHSGMDMGGMDMASPDADGDMGAAKGGAGAMAMDLNDIEYDAYLANDRTLDDPEVFAVEKGGRVRVRIINGATATAFTLDFGELDGTLIAVDGQPVQPVRGRRFPLSMGQRIDVRLELPNEARAFPVLALREGARERTGFVLRPTGAAVFRIAPTGDTDGPVLDLALEGTLRARNPLADRPADQVFDMALTGDMATYRWGLEANPPLTVKHGQRVEIALRNVSMMAHPMHLHGHPFQVVAVDGQRIAGAVRDTVLVTPGHTVTIAVDADNVGLWAFHCHHLYHMASGMMTTFAYVAPDSTLARPG